MSGLPFVAGDESWFESHRGHVCTWHDLRETGGHTAVPAALVEPVETRLFLYGLGCAASQVLRRRFGPWWIAVEQQWDVDRTVLGSRLCPSANHQPPGREKCRGEREGTHGYLSVRGAQDCGENRMFGDGCWA